MASSGLHQGRATQNMVQGLATSELPGRLLGMQIKGLHPTCTQSVSGGEAGNLYFTPPVTIFGEGLPKWLR